MLKNIVSRIRIKLKKTFKTEQKIIRSFEKTIPKEKSSSVKPSRVFDSSGRKIKPVKPPGQQGRISKAITSSKTTSSKSKNRWEVSQFKVKPLEGQKRFHDLGLPRAIMHAIYDLDFKYCTPIQTEVLEQTLTGRDASGRAQTGTGKTAAFLITIFTHILRSNLKTKRHPGVPRALIMAPTRELVLQITKDAQELSKYTPIRIQPVFGGMHYKRQKEQLIHKIVDVVVATPGRLIDFCQQKILDLGKVEILVIDEADRMLDMGFIPDIRKIINKTPPVEKRQTLMFSATLNDDVQRLSYRWTHNPVTVSIEPEQIAAESVNQLVYVVTTKNKFALLYNIITDQKLPRVLVFCNRRDETWSLAKRLHRYNICCAVLSGDVPQRKRIQVLNDFKSGKIRILVATDVAGRGIHIEDMAHVINYTLPNDPEDYVHRIGRTGRAGSTGTSISFACEEGAFQLPAIIEFVGHDLPSTRPKEKWLHLPPPPPKTDDKGKTNEYNMEQFEPPGRPKSSRKDSIPKSKKNKPGTKPIKKTAKVVDAVPLPKKTGAEDELTTEQFGKRNRKPRLKRF